MMTPPQREIAGKRPGRLLTVSEPPSGPAENTAESWIERAEEASNSQKNFILTTSGGGAHLTTARAVRAELGLPADTLEIDFLRDWVGPLG